LQQISQVLDATPAVLDLVYQDLTRLALPTTGREGLNAEQVLLINDNYFSRSTTIKIPVSSCPFFHSS
jgi:hypothetical protein